MKRILFTLLSILPYLGFSQNVIQITSDINSSTTWTADNIYELTGVSFIYVTNDAVLTIEPGTVVKGNPAALVITRGSKIFANGTKEQPIVFTSIKPAGQRNVGDWGGLLILGKATVNCPGGECTVEGGLDPVLGKYGGTDDNDNSGSLSYVRIEFAGIAFQPNNETNGLTLGGVGLQTNIDHVQVSHGGDDAFEWFGGTVNGKYLVANKTVDDMFDTDFGYRGINQFCIGISDPDIADISGSNGFEADNDAQGTTNAPQSASIFSNVTIIGPKKDPNTSINSNFRRGMHLRRSTKQSVRNSIISGFPTGLRLESSNSENYFLNTNELVLKNNIYAGYTKLVDSTSVQSLVVEDSLKRNNRTLANISDLKLTDPIGNAPNLIPLAGSAALSGSNFDNLPAFVEKTTYIGAMGTNNWTNCWCEWDAQNADYNRGIDYVSGIANFNFTVNNNQVQFNAPNLNNASFAWEFGDFTKSTEQNPVHSYQALGDYTVKLTVTTERGCTKSFSQMVTISQGAKEIAVTSDILTDTKWTNNNIYQLTGAPFIYVRNNATLTIEPGTIIKGNPAALIITRGSKIIAIGEKDMPIVFTSSKPVGQRAPGDWGGLLLLGKAKVNCPGGECTIEGGVDANFGKYGGNDDDDNSGTLKYVRIEYAGIAFQPNNETNSLTLGGVGSGTTIEHVQTTLGGDDAFEWFGGTVNGKYLIAYKTIDDMFDTDFGYTGNNQFVFGISDPDLADISGSNGFEADNDAQGTTNSPQSASIFSNVTILGPRQNANSTYNSNFKRGMHLRRSTKQSVVNSIIAGFPTGVRLESGNSENYYLNTNELRLSNNIISSAGKLFDSTSTNTQAIATQFQLNNRVMNTIGEMQLMDPYAAKPNAMPAAGSPALTGASFASLPPFFDNSQSNVGAFNDRNWTDCWAEWDPNNADYSFAPLSYFTESIDFTSSTNNNKTGFEPNLKGNYSYVWNFGDNSAESTDESPEHSYAASGMYTVSLEITNGRGCTKSYSKVINVIITSTRDLFSSEQIKVYPNPNNGNFSLEFFSHESEPARIEFINQLSSTVSAYNVSLNAGSNLFISSDWGVLPDGVYLLRISTAGKQISRMVMIQN